MKFLQITTIVILALLLLGLVSAQKPAAKPAAPVIKTVAAQTTAVQKTVFDGAITVLKKQLSEFEKIKQRQQNTMIQLEKESSALSSKSDSVYLAAKAELKVICDKELEKIAVQEQSVQQAKDKLTQDYQNALKALDEAKGITGGKQ